MEDNKQNMDNRQKQHPISKIMDFDIRLSANPAFRLLPFILYILLLIVLYIANEYYAQKTVIKLEKVNTELKELRAESLTIKAELMNKTKLTEIEKLTEASGLKVPQEPPKKIIAK